MRYLYIVAVVSLWATAAHSQPLTLADTLARARDGAPSVQAGRLQIDAARSAAVPARALPDPKFSVGVNDFPISGPLAGHPERDNFSMLKFGYSQEVPSRAKRQARIGRAQADITAAEATLLSLRRAAQVAAGKAWIALYYTERKLAALTALNSALRAEITTEPARLASGSTRPSAVLDPLQALAGVEDRRDALRAQLAQARADLGRWIDSADSAEPGGPAAETAVNPVALRANLDLLPALQVKAAAVRQAEAAAREAKADRRPDWGYDLEYGHRDPRFGDYVSGKLTFSLPLFAATRQNPMIAARLAQVNAAMADLEATRRELRAALESALAEHAMHHALLARARETLVPLAQRRAELERASYGARTASLTDVLTLQRAAVEAELTALDREAETASDTLMLTLTYGDLAS